MIKSPWNPAAQSPGSSATFISRTRAAAASVNAPTVSSTTPASNATVVSVPTTAIVSFSAAMAPSTVTLSLSPFAAVTGVVWSSGNTVATFTVVTELYNTSYTATVNGTSAAGHAMATPYSWSFTTSDPPPTITPVLGHLDFLFSETIVATGLTITVIVSSTQASVPGTTTYNSGTKIATFVPTTPFVAGTKYIATISGATAADGTAMASYNLVFTPGPAGAGKSWFAGLGRAVLRA